MFTLCIKDLRIYTNSRKYRRIHFVVLCVLTLCLFLGAIEYYAQGLERHQSGSTFLVGERTYSVLIICLFIAQFLVPKHAVESVSLERFLTNKLDGLHKHNNNDSLLILTPLSHWKIIVGKLVAVVLWSMLGVLLTIPLFALSIFMGGLPILQLMKCGLVILVSSLLFALIGISSAMWNEPKRAKTISYGIILALTFLPLFPLAPFVYIPMLDLLSPLSALFSILHSETMNLWLWNVCLISAFCVLTLSILIKKQ